MGEPGHARSEGPAARTDAPRKNADLKPRLIAGAIMAAVTLALTYAGPLPFALLIVAIGLVMSWEWGRVVRSEQFGPALMVHAAAVVAAVFLTLHGRPAHAVLVVAVAALLQLLLPLGPRRTMSAVGVPYVALPAVAMIWLRADEPLGFWAILFIFAVVWGSDIGAFAAGRTLGGPKLWPRVSPNKTWSGLIGALGAGLLAGIVFAQITPSAHSVTLALTGLALALVAQMGDLAESALKRRFGIKDASALIPGHGGVMDRADSTVAVSVTVAILALLTLPHAPARALLGL